MSGTNAGEQLELLESSKVSTVRRAPGTSSFSSPRRDVLLPLTCRCLSFRLPHELNRHKELQGDWDWRSAERRGDVGIDLGPRTSRRETEREQWSA